MPFCSNCGAKLIDNVKFCLECGEPNPFINNNDAQRKTVFDGEIHKCPNCGEIINSLTAVCPSCGFEFSGKHISTSLEKFINEVNACEQIISNSQKSVTGWQAWSKPKRFWWVVLNISFMCIPLVLYWVLPLIMINSTPTLTKEEQQLTLIIENFPFPNDRESILTALLFAKEKIDFISKEKVDRKSAYWMRLWCAKAEQLKQKADIFFPNDSIVKQSYDEISSDDEHVKKKNKVKVIIGVVIIGLVVAAFVARFAIPFVAVSDKTDYSSTFNWPTNGLFEKIPKPSTNNGKIKMESKNQIQVELYNIETSDFEAYVKSCRNAGFTVDVTKTDSVFYAKNDAGYNLSIFYYNNKDLMNVVVSSYDIENELEDSSNNDSVTPTTAINVKNFTFKLPDYWDEEGSKNEYLQYYAEKGDKVVMLSIAYPEESDDNFDVSFKGLYADNANMLKAVAGMFTDGDVVDHEVFESDYGIKGMLYRFTYKQIIDWKTKVDGSGYCFCFPSENDRRWFYVVLLYTNNVLSKDYKDDYMSMLADVKYR